MEKGPLGGLCVVLAVIAVRMVLLMTSVQLPSAKTVQPSATYGASVALADPSPQPTREPTHEPTRAPTLQPTPTRVLSQLAETKPVATPLPVDTLPSATPVPPSPTPTPTARPTIHRAESPPTRIVIPSIDLDGSVVAIGWHVEGASGKNTWDDPGEAVGWLKSSALPGAGSNVVLVGHNNIKGEVFRRLIDAEIGDVVYLVADRTTYRYRISMRIVVPEKDASPEQKERNAQWIAATPDERLTMITCWPYTGNTHRLVVVARPVP